MQFSQKIGWYSDKKRFTLVETLKQNPLEKLTPHFPFTKTNTLALKRLQTLR